MCAYIFMAVKKIYLFSLRKACVRLPELDLLLFVYLTLVCVNHMFCQEPDETQTSHFGPLYLAD